MAKPSRRHARRKLIANRLTAKERVALFCAAADIDHAAVGILSSTKQLMEIRGLIARGSATGCYQLTDAGRAVLDVLLERGGIGGSSREGIKGGAAPGTKAAP